MSVASDLLRLSVVVCVVVSGGMALAVSVGGRV